MAGEALHDDIARYIGGRGFVPTGLTHAGDDPSGCLVAKYRERDGIRNYNRSSVPISVGDRTDKCSTAALTFSRYAGHAKARPGTFAGPPAAVSAMPNADDYCWHRADARRFRAPPLRMPQMRACRNRNRSQRSVSVRGFTAGIRRAAASGTAGVESSKLSSNSLARLAWLKKRKFHLLKSTSMPKR